MYTDGLPVWGEDPAERAAEGEARRRGLTGQGLKPWRRQVDRADVPSGAGETGPLRLASWPTPLEPAPRLAGALGLEPNDLWIKRDDLTGLGGGGNKIRKLERTVGAAI